MMNGAEWASEQGLKFTEPNRLQLSLSPIEILHYLLLLAELSQAKLNLTEPNRTEPNRAKPNQTKPNQAGQAEQNKDRGGRLC